MDRIVNRRQRPLPETWHCFTTILLPRLNIAGLYDYTCEYMNLINIRKEHLIFKARCWFNKSLVPNMILDREVAHLTTLLSQLIVRSKPNFKKHSVNKFALLMSLFRKNVMLTYSERWKQRAAKMRNLGGGKGSNCWGDRILIVSMHFHE